MIISAAVRIALTAEVGLCSSSQVRMHERKTEKDFERRRCDFYDYLPCIILHELYLFAVNEPYALSVSPSFSQYMQPIVFTLLLFSYSMFCVGTIFSLFLFFFENNRVLF